MFCAITRKVFKELVKCTQPMCLWSIHYYSHTEKMDGTHLENNFIGNRKKRRVRVLIKTCMLKGTTKGEGNILLSIVWATIQQKI